MDRKSTILPANKFSKNNIALFLFAAMLVGLLCSRSISSIALFLFAVNALRDVHPRKWLRERWFLFGLVWVGVYAASALWSTDKGEWFAHFQTKFPFLFLPLAFGFLDPWTPRQLRIYTALFSGAMVLGACYSLSFMLRDPAFYISGYKYSHTLPTPAYNDHISFSACVAICIAWTVYSWRLWQGRAAKILLSVSVIFLVLYLHILAAKTGLLAFYLFLACYLVYLLSTSMKRGLLLGVVIAAGGYLAVTQIPTLREQVNYTLYSYERYQQGERTNNYNIEGRLNSYYLALNIIREKPLIGAGAGDLMIAMGEQYKKHYPQIPKERYILPHNQFFSVAVAVGIPALLAFAWWLCAPLARIRRNREGFFFLVVWLMLLIPLMVDPFLEVQFGVFTFLFFFLMQRSLLLQPPVAEETRPFKQDVTDR